MVNIHGKYPWQFHGHQPAFDDRFDFITLEYLLKKKIVCPFAESERKYVKVKIQDGCNKDCHKVIYLLLINCVSKLITVAIGL